MGVPLPGTGAWTGAALAALFKLSYAESLLGIVAGIISAGAIMTAVVLAGTRVFCNQEGIGLMFTGSNGWLIDTLMTWHACRHVGWRGGGRGVAVEPGAAAAGEAEGQQGGMMTATV